MSREKPCTHPIGAHVDKRGTQLLDDIAEAHPVDANPRTIGVIVTECTMCGTTVSTRLA